MGFCATQRFLYGLDIAGVGAFAFWRFFLKGVQDVDRIAEAGSIYGAVGIGVILSQHFEHPGPKALP